MKFKQCLTAAAAALAFCAGSAHANLVQNGSFEEGVSGEFTFLNTWHIYNDIANWDGGASGIEVRNNVAGTAQEGDYFVELDTTANSSMSQDISIGQAGLYTLSFWYNTRPDNGTRPDNTNLFNWSFGGSNGSVISSFSGHNSTTPGWQQFTQLVSFASATTATLTFAAGGTSDSYGGSLDNVSVTAFNGPGGPLTAVPEPETYAMMLAGLGLMGAIARRRKAKAA